jgi:NAD(P)-dependent dehydrogenase (short-subunit alcohol dehydrogenase family)
MDLKLHDKTALVTGSTQGLGFATVKKLCEENCTVYLNGRTQSSVNTAIKRIKDEINNAKIYGIVADLSTKEGCDYLTSQLSKVDILINNLGMFEPVEFEKITEEQWLECFKQM